MKINIVILTLINFLGDATDNEQPGRPRYWRTPSVVVSDYSDYSYMDERYERSDSELEKLDSCSASPSQGSSCSCLDCDELRDYHGIDNGLDGMHQLQVCMHRRHSDSCCLCLGQSALDLERLISSEHWVFYFSQFFET